MREEIDLIAVDDGVEVYLEDTGPLGPRRLWCYTAGLGVAATPCGRAWRSTSRVSG